MSVRILYARLRVHQPDPHHFGGTHVPDAVAAPVRKGLLNMEPFYTELAEIMEVDAVQADSVLRDFEEWDSLTVLSVISLMHSRYGVTVSAAELRQADTAHALYELTDRKRNGR